jgi:L-arabinonolactonase
VEITRAGAFTLGWGESLVWDDERRRLYFVDCAAQTLHWLDDDNDELHTLRPPSMPAGIVPADDGSLIGVLDDGLHVIDPDAGTTRLLTRYPDALGGRCNDACADLGGNLVTGRLNLGPSEGSAWWYSETHGWRLLDPDISNTNGPAVAVLDGATTLVIGDTAADYFAYAYEPETGSAGSRRVFGDVSALDGSPDGSTFDLDGGLWCALVGGGQLARFTTRGLDRTLPLPVPNPTDVTFGGAALDRLFVVSIAAAPGSGGSGLDGALLVIDGLGVTGRPEPRYALGSAA